MNSLLIIAFILLHSFYEAACSNFDLLRRQDIANVSSSISSLNDTMAQLGIPPVCYGNCSSPVNQTANCAEASCECTDDYEQAVYDCYFCTSTTLNLGFDAAQQKINTIFDKCARLGYHLKVLIYPGEAVISAATFSTETTSSTTHSHQTQSFGSHPQATQGTAQDSSPNEVDPQAAPELTIPENHSNGGTKLATGIFLSSGLVLLTILPLGFW